MINLKLRTKKTPLSSCFVPYKQKNTKHVSVFELEGRDIPITTLSINARTKFFISSNSDAPILELPSRRNMMSMGLLHNSEGERGREKSYFIYNNQKQHLLMR